MITGVRHSAIMVKDMEKALVFYRDLLGLTVVRDAIEEGEHIDRLLHLSAIRFREVKLSTKGTLEEGTVIELSQFLPPYEYVDFSHTALRVDDIEGEYKRLRKNGVEFLCPPFTSPDGYARVACCYDPDNYILELVEIL